MTDHNTDQSPLNISNDHFTDADDQVDPTVAQHALQRDARIQGQQRGQVQDQVPEWGQALQQQLAQLLQIMGGQIGQAQALGQVQAANVNRPPPPIVNQPPPVVRNQPPPPAQVGGVAQIPLPPVNAFDVVGECYYTGAVDDEGTNPVALAIDREILDRRAIKMAEPGAGTMEMKFAIEGYTNLDPIKKYDMNLGPREFDVWKDAWCDQAAKAARGHHPSQIKHRCWLELKKSLSPNTLNWIQNAPELHGRRDDPDFIVKRLQEQARGMANVANMLFRAAQAKYNTGDDIKEIFNETMSVTRYFEKACRGDVLDGVAKWLLLIRFGHVKRLNARMYEKWDRLTCHELFQLIEHWFETETGSNDLFTPGQVYLTQAKPDWQKGKAFNSKPSQNTGQGQQNRSRGPSSAKNRSRSASVPRNSSSGNKKCGWCGRQQHPRDQCPAKERKCQKCNKMGHFQHVCRSTGTVNTVESAPKSGGQTQASINNVQVSSDSVRIVGLDLELNSIVVDTKTETRAATVDLGAEKLDMVLCILTDSSGNSMQMNSLPDTGANINLMPDKLAKTFATYKKCEVVDDFKPKTVSGTLDILGIVRTDVWVNDTLLKDVIWCTANIGKALLSRKSCREAGMIHENFPFCQLKESGPKPKKTRPRAYMVDPTNPASGFDTLPDHSDKKPLVIDFPKARQLEEIAKKFPEVFDGHIGRVNGPPAHIELRADAVPTSSGAHRRIAEAHLGPLKAEIEEQVAAGILEKVEETPEANYWLHPIVVVPKKGTSKVRLCVDFRRLNQFCIRPSNPEGTPWEKIRTLPAGKRWYAVFDANKGYHQVPLDEESRKLTTFYTPHGKYRYLSLPMGYAGSQDIFTQRFGAAVDKFVDARATEDCLIIAGSEEELLHRVEKFFEACKASGITLNTKKTQAGSEVLFAGYLINEKGATLDPALYKAIKDFPTPRTLTDLRSFLGLAQQQANFTSHIAELSKPFHPLLKKANDWLWTVEMSQAFEKMKDFLSAPAALAYYDHRRQTRLYTDASRLNGLGFVLKQKQDDGYWKTVQAGSRFLSSAEERYAMVELELLAIAWACKKAAAYVEGIQFTIVTDHRPLIPILKNYSLAEIENKRLQRLRMKIDHLTYDCEWIKGTENKEADALSRSPCSRPEPEDELDEPTEIFMIAANIMELEVNAVFGSQHYDEAIDSAIEQVDPNSDLLLKSILDNADEDYATVREWIRTGFPERSTVDVRLDPYIREQDQFRLDGDIILHLSPESSSPRLLIPASLRQRCLEFLKMLHCHPNKMAARARKSFWWPFMNSDIQKLHRSCQTCVEKAPSNPQDNILTHQPASYPFQFVHFDLAQYAGKQWLIGADQFSGWPLVKCLGNDSSGDKVIEAFSQLLTPFGIPEKIFSDGGPQFTSKTFSDFCKRNFIENTTSSPYNPQSNGIAENAVKEMKKLIHCLYDKSERKVPAEKWMRAMLIYINTPRRPLNLSPAQLLFGRELRDGLPISRDLLMPEHQAAVLRRCQAIKEHRLALSKGDRLPELAIGQRVAVQDRISKKWSESGKVIAADRKRSYSVKLDSGAIVWRNRRFLKPVPSSSSPLKPTPTGPQQPTGPRRSTRQSRAPQRFGQ